MKPIDLTQIYENYKGMWVTLTENHKVISAHKTAQTAYQEAIKKGYKRPRLLKVPRENLPFIGAHSL